jgi:hypothetical protein
VYLEVGPKRALKGFVDEALGGQADVTSALTCHPKTGEAASFNQALCALWAAGYGAGERGTGADASRPAIRWRREETDGRRVARGDGAMSKHGGNGSNKTSARPGDGPQPQAQLTDGVDVLASALSIALDRITQMNAAAPGASQTMQPAAQALWDRAQPPAGSVVITGTGLGLPRARAIPAADAGPADHAAGQVGERRR